MTYVFDIDGTICTKQCELQGDDYRGVEPLADRINKINSLYEQGNKIIYMTARGMGRNKSILSTKTLSSCCMNISS